MTDATRRYCLDTDVFIQAKNSYYAFDIAPGFWHFIDEKSHEGLVYRPIRVYRELEAGNDELAEWVKDRREGGLFIEPNKSVQEAFSHVAQYVTGRYEPHAVRIFLDGADPWLVAHGLADRAIVVTQEIRVTDESSKIKIPNICDHFDVPWTDTYQMLRSLEARFQTG